MSSLRDRWETLGQVLKREKRVLVAFSGGADSTLLLQAALHFLKTENVLAVTAVSPSLTQAAKLECAQLAKKLNSSHLFVETSEMNNRLYTSNSSNRCFYCKDELFSQLFPLAQLHQLSIIDGFNFSDRADFRPGFQAAQKWNVIHPLDDARLTKKDIRRLSRWQKLSTWNKPASPCLSSRIPYGTAVTRSALRMIELAETVLHDEGFLIARVRHFGDEAKIEVPIKDISRLQEKEKWQKVFSALQKVGYQKIVVDSEGFRSGKLSEVVK